jgi:hypothetical protein
VWVWVGLLYLALPSTGQYITVNALPATSTLVPDLMLAGSGDPCSRVTIPHSLYTNFTVFD